MKNKYRVQLQTYPKSREFIYDQITHKERSTMCYEDMNEVEQEDLAVMIYGESSNEDRAEWLYQNDIFDAITDNVFVCLNRDTEDNRDVLIDELKSAIVESAKYSANLLFKDTIDDICNLSEEERSYEESQIIEEDRTYDKAY